MTPSDPRALEGLGMEPKPQYGQIQGFLATDTGFNPMAALQRGGYTPKTAKDFSNQQAREEFARGLESKAGIPVKRDAKGNADPQSVADGVNILAAQRYQAQFKGFDPFNLSEMFKTTAEGANTAPAAAQGAVEEIGQAGRDIKSTRLGQTSTAQGIESTAQELSAVADARKSGFGNVTRSNIGQFRDAKGAHDWLQGTKQETDALLSQLRTGQPLDADQFGNLLTGLTQAPKFAEGIGTEAGQANFMATMRRDKSLGQVVQEAHGFGDLAGLAAKNAIAPQEQAVILKNLSDLLDLQLKSGKAANELNQYRTGRQRAEQALHERGSAAARAKNLPKYSSPSDPGFAALPSGAWFLDGTGKKRQKH